jgi:aminoglycoside phosphotransferase
MQPWRDLPAEIEAVVGPDLEIERPFQGIDFETLVLHSERGRFVLKVGRDKRLAGKLAHEQRVLVALAAQRPFVPEPLAFVLEDEGGYSLLSYLPGRNGAELALEADTAGGHALAAAYAWTLRRIHTWETELPQPADWLNTALDRVERYIRLGLVENPMPHPGRWRGAHPDELLAELRSWRPTVTNDLVFCHGDYCMPNVLLEHGRVTGVIDWPEGAYADRRYDLATACWSIRYNLKDESYVRTFLTAYGYAQPAVTLEPFEALYVLT